ncbi:hypothetical protein HanIR_Chr10g0478481 [Helianthus annuus]|nr:hypothetical protein HanIR_Chr10g0478481 [Helianthus annuus]
MILFNYTTFGIRGETRSVSTLFHFIANNLFLAYCLFLKAMEHKNCTMEQQIRKLQDQLQELTFARGVAFKGGWPRTFCSVVLGILCTFRIEFFRYIRFRPPGFIRKKFTYIEFLGPVTSDPPVKIFKLHH